MYIFQVRTFGGYITINELGQGCLSKVYKAKQDDGSIVALKKCENQKFVFQKNIYQELNHVNVVQVYAHFNDGSAFIAMEFCELGDLNYFLSKRSTNLSERLRFMVEMASGLHYLHKKNVIHGNLKPENVLFTNNTEDHSVVCKISDFVFSRNKTEIVSHVSTKAAASHPYMAQEILDGKEYSNKADIFSLGVIFFALYKNEFFHGPEHHIIVPGTISCQGEIEHVHDILRKEKLTSDIFISSYFSDLVDLGELVFRMVSIFPDKRSNMEEVLVKIVTIKEHDKIEDDMAKQHLENRQLRQENTEIKEQVRDENKLNSKLHNENQILKDTLDKQEMFMKQIKQKFIAQEKEKDERAREIQNELLKAKFFFFQEYQRLEHKYISDRNDFFKKTCHLEEEKFKLQREIHRLKTGSLLKDFFGENNVSYKQAEMKNHEMGKKDASVDGTDVSASRKPDDRERMKEVKVFKLCKH